MYLRIALTGTSWLLSLCVLVLATADRVDVFSKGEAGYYCIKIPSLTLTAAKSLIATGEARLGDCSDFTETHLVAKRSVDGGATWSPLSIIYREQGHVIGQSTPVVLRGSGRILLVVRSVMSRVAPLTMRITHHFVSMSLHVPPVLSRQFASLVDVFRRRRENVVPTPSVARCHGPVVDLGGYGTTGFAPGTQCWGPCIHVFVLRLMCVKGGGGGGVGGPIKK
jgi:hypothetical protein